MTGCNRNKAREKEGKVDKNFSFSSFVKVFRFIKAGAREQWEEEEEKLDEIKRPIFTL